MTIDVRSLFVTATKEGFFAAFLDLGQALGLPVASWRGGDPTLVEGQFLSEQLAQRDAPAVQFTKSSFLSTAEGDWLKVHASEVYGVETEGATFATPTVTLLNSGGGLYEIEPGGLTVKCSVTGVTFKNTNDPGTLSGGTSRTYELVADVQGSGGTVAVDDIDEIVSPTLLGVSITGSTAGTGLDEQSPEAIRVQCGSTLGALSAAGPKDAYENVCRDPEKTDVTEITRARSADDSDDGTLTVYVASAVGTVSGPSVTAAQNACATWAEPRGFRATVTSAVARPVNIVIEVSGAAVPADIEGQGTLALGKLFAALQIAAEGGDTLDPSLLAATIHALAPQPAIRKVVVVSPGASVVLAAGEVPTLGTVSITPA